MRYNFKHRIDWEDPETLRCEYSGVKQVCYRLTIEYKIRTCCYEDDYWLGGDLCHTVDIGQMDVETLLSELNED